MINFHTAYTLEVDDPSVAADDMLRQLDPSRLKAHSMGLIFSSPEMIENGTAGEISARLPFETAGVSTNYMAVPGAVDCDMAALWVMTSDTARFAMALSPPLSEGPWESLRVMCEEARGKLGREAALAFGFAPMFIDGDMDHESMMEPWVRLMGSTPLFGSLALNYEGGLYHPTKIIHNGRVLDDRAALVLAAGDLKPRFRMAAVPEGNIFRQEAVITKARGRHLIEVNDRPVVEYMDSLGLMRDGRLTGCHLFPFIITHPGGGPPVSRTALGLTAEGHVKCAGRMYEGASISIGAQDVASIISAARKVLMAGRDLPDVSAALIFSSNSRRLTLGLEEEAEALLAAEMFGRRIPYLFCCSGGEICPRTVGAESANALHSDTIAACYL